MSCRAQLATLQPLGRTVADSDVCFRPEGRLAAQHPRAMSASRFHLISRRLMRHDLARVGALFAIALTLALGGCHPYNQTYYTAATRERYVHAGIGSPIVE